MPPTLVLTNAAIETGDPRRPWATALALDGEMLAAIGSAAEILKLADASTRIVNLQGRPLVLPAGSAVGQPLRVTFSNEGDVVGLTRSDRST